jgi:Uncharacterized protein conserved in bacteria (DUF2252)
MSDVREGDPMSRITPGVLAPPHEVLTPDEWRARGRERRRSAPRSSQAQWAPPADRPDPVAVLEEQAKSRVPDLVPVRYGRMVASPFARLTVSSYRTEMANYAAMRFLKVWYSRIEVDEVSKMFDSVQSKAAARRRRRDIAKAGRRTSQRALLKLCDQVDGQYRIRPAYPLIVRLPIDIYPVALEELRSAVALYRQTLEPDRREVPRRYYFGDFARKVVGVGSVGTEAFVMLLIGDQADEPLFLQLKQAQESVLAPFAGPSEYEHHGERVVMGQRLTQAASDPFLGWTSDYGIGGAPAKHYYVRQLHDMKGSMSVALMDPEQLGYYGRLCGWTLARAHARTGRAAMISGYMGTSEIFDHAIADFASAYADQNEQDYQRLLEAVSSGRVLATIEQ